MEITISIDVQNYKEVIQKEKGKVAELFAGLFIDKEKLKREVERKICEEIVKQLEPKIKEQLAARGVEAEVDFEIHRTTE